MRPPTWRASRSSAPRCGPDFNQLSGEDITALGFNAHGGHGCISVTSNVAPRLCAEFQAACLQRRLRGRAEAAGQARAAAHQPVRRDEPGADQVRDVAARQVQRRRAAADGAGDREGAGRGARGHGACRADQLSPLGRMRMAGVCWMRLAGTPWRFSTHCTSAMAQEAERD